MEVKVHYALVINMKKEDVEISISGWTECSLVDVIGSVTFTLWFSYCNFRCPWCQNAPVVKGKDVKRVKVKSIIERVIESREFIDYLHVTGGEPTLQAKGLISLFTLAKENNIKTSLSTNGSNPEVIRKLIEKNLIDHIAIDIKAPLNNENKYSISIGLSLTELKNRNYLEKIKESLEISLRNIPIIELRVPIVPNIHTKEDVLETIDYLSKIINNKKTKVDIVLQQFVPSETVLSEEFRKITKTPLGFLHSIASEVIRKGHLKKIYIRSIDKGVEIITKTQTTTL